MRLAHLLTFAALGVLSLISLAAALPFADTETHAKVAEPSSEANAAKKAYAFTVNKRAETKVVAGLKRYREHAKGPLPMDKLPKRYIRNEERPVERKDASVMLDPGISKRAAGLHVPYAHHFLSKSKLARVMKWFTPSFKGKYRG